MALFCSLIFTESLEIDFCCGMETVLQIPLYNVSTVYRDAHFDLEKILGKPIIIAFNLPDGKAKRYINGIVTRIEQGQTKQRGTEYILEIRPKLWLLTLKSNCAVYQKKNVIEIVTGILQKENINVSNKTSGSFPKLEYVVQYNETDFDFVSRLLEESGIFYFFTHTENDATMVLGNKPDIFKVAPQAEILPFVFENLSKTPKVEIGEVVIRQQTTLTKVSLNDYNFTTPTTSLLAADGEKTLERYHYPGNFLSKSDGENVAKNRLKSETAQSVTLHAVSAASGLSIGTKFKIKGHPRNDVNSEWIVTKTNITASQEEYRAEIEAIPATVAPIPVPKTPKPRIYGVLSALVVGKSGEEIQTDEYGRIKVQFYWDREGKRDENSSCWVRVAQSWAGSNFGTMFIPRIGQEVLVSFEDGDPNRPIVTGVVYNESNKPPYPLPANATRSVIKTRSSKQGNAGNEISFEDKKDSEEIFVHAQKDLKIEVENKRSAIIKESDDSLTIKKGNSTFILEKGNETRKIKGNVDWTVDGDFTLTVKGNLTIKADGSVTLQSGKDVTLKSGTDVTVKAGAGMTIKAEIDATVKTGTGLTLKGGTELDAEAGTSLNLKGNVGFNLKSSAQGTVDGGGMLNVKGGLVKIN
ncbi:MAG: type VI secretion system tip protein VgrG [Planctomycetaceae bacterium]|jgi:type VI secretion system secreted protein VgrG|nr:type VI secretion system tip protein VgrG [Planctomycetaceae bacterium]